MTFEIKGNQFIKDGKPIKIISGAVHYFRNLPDTWTDIFRKLRAIGCNCVETYCAWNLHEKKPNEFDFNGMLNIALFLRKAQEEGLMAIVRPGPYICAEWEFGGLPWWLLAQDNMQIRCFNPEYLKCFDRYLDRLFEEIKPMLSTNGGNVIMMQCENEYGSYGDDKEYLSYLKNGYIRRGIDVPLFTSDGPIYDMLKDGAIEGALPMLNFGSNVAENFKLHDELYPNVPKMCMELWNGWFDHWQDDIHHTTSAETYAKVLDEMLTKGSVNMYMFIGGTNFGFMNGANHYDKYEPTVTSYDYDALLSECGDVTPKYLAVREVIKKHVDYPLPNIPANRIKKAFGKIILDKRAGFFNNLDNLSQPIRTAVPECMEKYGQGYGYIAYRTTLNRDYENAYLWFESLGDRAVIYINNSQVGKVYINDEKTEICFTAKQGDILTVLCENMGRTNYGAKMMRKKGIAGKCLINGKLHFGWDVFTLPMDNLDKLEFSNKPVAERTAFYQGDFQVDEPADTFLKLKNFSKGFVVVNGFNIGRYWKEGPQKTMYVPCSLLKKGRNIVTVFDSDGVEDIPEVEFTAVPELC